MGLPDFDYRFSERKNTKQSTGEQPELSGAATDVLWCLFKQGPTWDGDLPSKSGRSDLVDKGYAERADGWNWLTASGTLLAINNGLGLRKEGR
ncbi:hypothetical protein RU07_20660 [Agrobacterium tumefaciens]|uniref:Uncharacterized protein n=1 Tax=Agrobacterium tumefaciens TaxID=358 RepID=A0A0D0JUC7_AGRTU|nr:hypothetical protein RU07_20660 [Agrobacterium tumefaciens]